MSQFVTIAPKPGTPIWPPWVWPARMRSATDSAVQIPSGGGGGLGDGGARPLGGLTVELGGDLRVRLDEGTRSEGEPRVTNYQRQNAGLSEDDLFGSFDDRLVRGVDVRGDD